MRIFLYTLVVYFLFNINNAYAIKLENENKIYNLKEVNFFEDKTNNLTINEIEKKTFDYKDLNKSNIPYSKSTYWFKLDLENLNGNSDWILEIDFVKLYDVSIFYKDEKNNFIYKENGTKFLPDSREIKSRKIAFNLFIPKDKSKTIFIRIYSPNSALQVPINIYNKNNFYSNLLIEEAFYLSFMGIIFGMIIYNISILIFFKEITYLYYTFFNSILLLLQLSLYGYGYFYLWKNSNFEFTSIRALAYLLYLSFMIFIIKFLEIKKENKLYYLLISLVYLNLISIFLTFYNLDELYLSSIIIFSETLFLVLLLTFKIFRDKKAHITMLYFSWIIFSIGSIIFNLNRSGLIEKNFLTDNLGLLTSAIASIIISIALTEKFKIYKIEKEKYYEELEIANNELRNYKQNLETLVNNKTSELIEAKNYAENMAKIKSDFLSAMSHDIRTPINGVIGITDLLSHTKLNEEQKDLVNTINYSSEILLNLVNDILDISKFEAGKMELSNSEFDLRKTIEEIIDILTSKIEEKNLDIFYYVDETIPEKIITDAIKLKRVLINLISNAIKFTEKGSIKIDVLLTNKDNEYVELLFLVKDSGIGIPEDKKERLFKPFSQTDASITNKFGGTGLGLIISKNIVELMNGDIGFENNKDYLGTTFKFNIKVNYINKIVNNKFLAYLKDKKLYLDSENTDFIETIIKYAHNCNIKIFNSKDYPLDNNYDLYLLDQNKKESRLYEYEPLIIWGEPIYINKKAKYLPKPLKTNYFYNVLKQALNNHKNTTLLETINYEVKEIENLASKYPIKILVAEDNLVNQKLIKKVLEKLGYIPDIVNNGNEAIQKCIEKNFDLIFMDLQMPEVDGIEASKIINATIHNKAPKIVALTANVLEEQQNECYNAGMIGFLTKPYKINDIEAIISELFS
ncbi:MAG: ATP-binding protein [Candidatus Sericytochromatia bacterium]